MAEKFNPAPHDKHAADPREAMLADREIQFELVDALGRQGTCRRIHVHRLTPVTEGGPINEHLPSPASHFQQAAPGLVAEHVEDRRAPHHMRGRRKPIARAGAEQAVASDHPHVTPALACTLNKASA